MCLTFNILFFLNLSNKCLISAFLLFNIKKSVSKFVSKYFTLQTVLYTPSTILSLDPAMRLYPS